MSYLQSRSLITPLFLEVVSKPYIQKIFGGILNRQDNAQDVEEMTSFSIPQIDAVIVDLYPFEKTVASGASNEDIIEKN